MLYTTCVWIFYPHGAIWRMNLHFTSMYICVELVHELVDDEQLWYFISERTLMQAFEHSDPFKGFPGSHSQLISCSVGIMSSWLLLAFHSQSASHHCINVASASLFIVATPVLKATVKPIKVMLHSNSVHDINIVRVISVDTHKLINQQTWKM